MNFNRLALIVEQMQQQPFQIKDVSMDDENVKLFPEDEPDDGIEWKKVENKGSVLYFEESDKMIWIIFVYTDPRYRKLGRAKELVNFIHRYAQETNRRIEHGSYTEDGEKFLKPINIRLGSEDR